MSDLKLNKLVFNHAKLYDDIFNIADRLMDQLEKLFIESMAAFIDVDGNGTDDMKKTAKQYIRGERTRTPYGLEVAVGVDPSYAQKGSVDYVRISVVLFGNQATAGTLYEKPGEETWDKGIFTKRMPEPDRRTGRKLPDGFNQFSVVVAILDNVLNYDMKRNINDYLDRLMQEISRIDMSSYLEVR